MFITAGFSQAKDELTKVYSKEFQKMSSVEFKHHRFTKRDRMSSAIEVKAVGGVLWRSPNYKNKYRKLHLESPNTFPVYNRPLLMNGPRYKNRRFR